MGKSSPDKNRHIASVKLGPKGQIVIPKEVREIFDLKPGDSLILLADKKRGIALQRLGVFNQLADAIFSGRAKEVYPDSPEEDSLTFAQAIKAVAEEPEEAEEAEEEP